jgi:hypothetical protein
VCIYAFAFIKNYTQNFNLSLFGLGRYTQTFSVELFARTLP